LRVTKIHKNCLTTKTTTCLREELRGHDPPTKETLKFETSQHSDLNSIQRTTFVLWGSCQKTHFPFSFLHHPTNEEGGRKLKRSADDESTGMGRSQRRYERGKEGWSSKGGNFTWEVDIIKINTVWYTIKEEGEPRTKCTVSHPRLSLFLDAHLGALRGRKICVTETLLSRVCMSPVPTACTATLLRLRGHIGTHSNSPKVRKGGKRNKVQSHTKTPPIRGRSGRSTTCAVGRGRRPSVFPQWESKKKIWNQ